MKPVTVIFLETEPFLIISKKDYSKEFALNQQEIRNDFPEYKTTLTYEDEEKFLEFITSRWGNDDKTIKQIKDLLASEKITITQSDVVKA